MLIGRVGYLRIQRPQLRKQRCDCGPEGQQRYPREKQRRDPAYLLRNYSVDNRKRVWQDMQKVMAELGLNSSPSD